ncbi:hypothetical protein IWQ61_009881 [Dispira simplex]|nr:hypothetical protein IWQ61_009881 [Dispira simplex]
MESERKMMMCIASCDSWPCFMLCMAMLRGEARRCIEKMCCAVTDENSEYARRLKEQGAHLVPFSREHMEPLGQCFEKSDMVVMMPPLQKQDRMEMWKMMLECMRRAKGKRCALMMSVMHADKGHGKHMKELHQMEMMFMDMMSKSLQLGLKDRMMGKICRCAPSMEMLFLFRDSIRNESKIALPIKDGEWAPASMRDIGEAMIKMGQHHMQEEAEAVDHRMMCFTGCHMLSGKKMAQEASELFGTRMEFKPMSMDEARHYLEQMGEMSHEEIECFMELCEMINKNMMREVCKDLEKVLGRKPMAMRDFFQHHEDQFKPQR